MAHLSDKNNYYCFQLSSAQQLGQVKINYISPQLKLKKIPHFFRFEDECLQKTELCQYVQELLKAYKGL